MNDEMKYILWRMGFILLAIVAGVTICRTFTYHENVKALENGYQQIYVPGNNMPIWQKVTNGQTNILGK